MSVSGSVSGDMKPRSVRSYATFGHGRNAHPQFNQHPPLSFALSTTTTTHTIASSSSVAGDDGDDGDGNTVVDEMEWPVRTQSHAKSPKTHSFIFHDHGEPPAPPPNRPLPLPLPLAVGGGARASSATTASSSLSSMMAAATATNRGVIGNVDVDDTDDEGEGEGEGENSSSRARRHRLDTLEVDHGRDARPPLVHRRMSSDALGYVIRDLEGMGVTSVHGDGDVM